MGKQERQRERRAWAALPDAGRARPEGGAEQAARFKEAYRSRDGLITVFEDGEGHLTSIASRRLV